MQFSAKLRNPITIDEAIDSLLDSQRARQDYTVPISTTRFGLNSQGNALSVEVKGRPFEPTPHAMKQMANWCGVSHAVLNQYTRDVYEQNGEIRYKRDAKDTELLLALFQNGMRDGRIDPDKEFRFRTYSDGTLRAMLSTQYAPVDNVWYLEQLKKIFGELGGDEPRFVHWQDNPDTMFGNLLLGDTVVDKGDSPYGGMFSIGNCEIGTRRLYQLLALWREVCTNGMMGWTQVGDKINKVHRGTIDLNDLSGRIRSNINEQVPMIGASIDRFIALRDRRLEVTPDRMIAQIAQEHKLTFGQNGQAAQTAIEWGTHEAEQANLFGIVNAITRAAQKFDADEQIRLEGIGGSFMNLSDSAWTRYNSRAKNMEDKVYDKIYGRVAA